MNVVIKDGIIISKLQNSLLSLNISQATATVMVSCYEKKSSKLTKLLLSRSLVSNKVLDLDWSFGVTASSDDCDQVGKTYLQVKVKVDTGSDGIRDIFFEMTLEQFYVFLAELEKCKSFLDAIATI